MQEELLIESSSKRNYSKDQHARGTSHRNNMEEDLLTESTCKRLVFTESTCKRNFSQD